MPGKKADFAKRYETVETFRLIRIVHADRADYEPEAVEAAEEELARRSLAPEEEERLAERAGEVRARQLAIESQYREPFSLEIGWMNLGVPAGILMLVVAIVWFVGALSAGWLFFYPPILAFAGLCAIVRGVRRGNAAGKETRRPERPPGRSGRAARDAR